MARIMKDSRNMWIGSVPQEWQVKRLKHCANLYTGNSIKDEDKDLYADPADSVPYISSKDINKQYSTIDYENGMYTKVTDTSFKIAHTGDTLMCIEGGSAGKKKALLARNVSFVNKLCCLNPDKQLQSKYLYYFLQTPSFEDEFAYSMTGMIGGVSVGSLLNFRIPIPPKDEQEKIVAFLDEKCERIDKVTKKLEKQIEVLEEYKNSVITEAVTKGLNPTAPMKDSGVKWVGKIPENWNIIRGKYILKYLQKPVKEDDGVITCFRDGEVTLRSKRREDGFTISGKEIGYQGIDVGDLVVHGMDGFAGAIGISDSRGKASPVLNVLDTKQNKKYIMYYLRSMAYNDVFVALATGIRVRSCDLRWNKLATLPYVIPPLSEQADIVKFIDIQLEKIKKIISQKQKAIETLNEYKKSLIFEYVTGKKEVA